MVLPAFHCGLVLRRGRENPGGSSVKDWRPKCYNSARVTFLVGATEPYAGCD